MAAKYQAEITIPELVRMYDGDPEAYFVDREKQPVISSLVIKNEGADTFKCVPLLGLNQSWPAFVLFKLNYFTITINYSLGKVIP